jgi:hypothetical protein
MFCRGLTKSYHVIKTPETIEGSAEVVGDYVWSQVQGRRR